MKYSRTPYKRTKLEITNMTNGCLEQGGVCGRIVSYPTDLICTLLEETEEGIAFYESDELPYVTVPNMHITLIDMLNYLYKDYEHVIRKGVVIE